MLPRSLVPAAVALALVGGPLVGTAAAGDKDKAGPFTIRNTSGSAVKLSDLTYTDRTGTERKIDAEWDIKAGDFSRLTHNGNAIVATKVKVNLVTDAGTTCLTWTSNGVDADGDFVCELAAKDIAKHLQLLGKVDAAAERKARQAVQDLEGQIGDTKVRIAVAIAALVVAEKAYDDAPPGSFQEVVAEGVYLGAKEALTTLYAALQRQEAELRSARQRLNSLRD